MDQLTFVAVASIAMFLAFVAGWVACWTYLGLVRNNGAATTGLKSGKTGRNVDKSLIAPTRRNPNSAP